MKLRTRLLITFCTIVLLPIVLSTISIFGIFFYVKSNARAAYDLDSVDVSLILDPVKGFTQLTDEEYELLINTSFKNSSDFEDQDFLATVNDTLSSKSSFLLIRKDDAVYYSGNEERGDLVFSSLTKYGMEDADGKNGYYLNNLETVIRQVDFHFSDGTEGSAFIITKVTTFLNMSVVRNVLIMIIIILIFTSFTLTRWIQCGVFAPINDLNKAMKHC